MSEIKRGSMVNIVNMGSIYTRYSEMFNHMTTKYSIKGFSHAYEEYPSKDEVFSVVAVEEHPNATRDTVVLIHNNNKEGYLFEIKGLKLA